MALGSSQERLLPPVLALPPLLPLWIARVRVGACCGLAFARGMPPCMQLLSACMEALHEPLSTLYFGLLSFVVVGPAELCRVVCGVSDVVVRSAPDLSHDIVLWYGVWM